MRRVGLASLLAGALGVASVAPAAARPAAKEPRPEVAQQIQTLRGEVAEASAEESSVLERLDQVRARRGQLDARVKVLDEQLAPVAAAADEAEARLAAVQAEFVRAQSRLGHARDQLAGARREVRQRAVAAYVGDPSSRPAEMVLRAGSLRQLAATARYLESAAEAGKKVVARYRGLRDSTEALHRSAESTKDEARAQWNVVVARRSSLEAVRSDLDATRRSVLAEESEHQALIVGARSRAAEFERQIAALRSDSDSVTGLLRGLQLNQVPIGPGSGVLGAPLPGAVLGSLFGPRVHPILGTLRMHDGLDYRAPAGTPIRAAGGGIVVYAGPRGGYGNTVVVDHGGSLATLYAHQSAIYVRSGTVVSRGQVIGAVGSTGLSTGPHLHFEVRLNGTPVNPLAYL